jgi:hypothetical protein
VSSSASGAVARAETCEATIRWPDPSTSSIVIVQRTDMRSGGVPSRASSLPSEVTQQVACAAARSSSGLVFPWTTSTRDAIVAESSNAPVLSAFTTPAPRAVVPSQSISASRTIRGTSGASGDGGALRPLKTKHAKDAGSVRT